MPVFRYQATDLSGRVSTGDVTAESVDEAREQLRSRGLTATTLQEATADASASLSSSEQAQLVQQVSDLIAAKVPLSIGLRALAEDIPSTRLREVLLGMSNDLEAGMAIEVVFERWSASLPSYFTGMIRASKRAGAMSQGLTQFSDLLRLRAQGRSNMLMAVMYPGVLGLIGASIGLFLVTFIVPKFKSIFEGFGTEMPGATRLLISLSDLAMQPLFLFAVLVIGLGACLLVTFLKRSTAAMQLLYLIPFYGPMLRYRGLSEFSLMLEMMIRNGVPLPEALRLASEGVSDANLSAGAMELMQLVNAGLSLGEAARQLPHFSPDFMQTVSVSRSESELCDSLRISSERFMGLCSIRLRFWGLAMEPLLVTTLGVMIGFVVIALFMPLIKLLNDLS